jgi:hypothetical protein
MRAIGRAIWRETFEPFHRNVRLYRGVPVPFVYISAGLLALSICGLGPDGR